MPSVWRRFSVNFGFMFQAVLGLGTQVSWEWTVTLHRRVPYTYIYIYMYIFLFACEMFLESSCCWMMRRLPRKAAKRQLFKLDIFLKKQADIFFTLKKQQQKNQAQASFKLTCWLDITTLSTSCCIFSLPTSSPNLKIKQTFLKSHWYSLSFLPLWKLNGEPAIHISVTVGLI